MPLVSLTPVVHLELRISPRIFEKSRIGPNCILRGFKKNQKSKISWHCPFKLDANRQGRYTLSFLLWLGVRGEETVGIGRQYRCGLLYAMMFLNLTCASYCGRYQCSKGKHLLLAAVFNNNILVCTVLYTNNIRTLFIRI